MAIIQKAIIDFERSNPNYQRAADMVYEWEANLFRKKFEAGIVNKTYYNKGLAKEDYVPLMRDFSREFSDAAQSFIASGGAGTGRQSAMRNLPWIGEVCD